MLHAVGFLIDHRYVPDEYRKHDDAMQLQNRIKQVPSYLLKKLEDISNFCLASEYPILHLWWHLPRILFKKLSHFLFDFTRINQAHFGKKRR